MPTKKKKTAKAKKTIAQQPIVLSAEADNSSEATWPSRLGKSIGTKVGKMNGRWELGKYAYHTYKPIAAEEQSVETTNQKHLCDMDAIDFWTKWVKARKGTDPKILEKELKKKGLTNRIIVQCFPKGVVVLPQ